MDYPFASYLCSGHGPFVSCYELSTTMEPISALAILHGTSAAVSATITVTNTLIQISNAISEVDRTLQQLQREVTGLQETLERMSDDFSGPSGRQLVRTSTGALGNHWRAVLKIIGCADRTLNDMESCLRRVPHNGGSNWSKPLRAAWLSFKNGDLAYYRSEIDMLGRNMQFELMMVLVYVLDFTSRLAKLTQYYRCRGMDGPNNSNAQGFPVDLMSTENEWRTLHRNAATIQSHNPGGTSANSIGRKPVESFHATSPFAGTEYLRQRQLETAKDVQDYLSTASDLLSTASTVCGQPYAQSVADTQEQSPEQRAKIMAYIEGQRNIDMDDDIPRVKDKRPVRCCKIDGFFVFRVLGGTAWLGVTLAIYGMMFVYLVFWAAIQIVVFCMNVGDHWRSLVKDFGRINGFIGKGWRLILGTAQVE
jgi:hypothetical protein